MLEFAADQARALWGRRTTGAGAHPVDRDPVVVSDDAERRRRAEEMVADINATPLSRMRAVTIERGVRVRHFGGSNLVFRDDGQGGVQVEVDLGDGQEPVLLDHRTRGVYQLAEQFAM